MLLRRVLRRLLVVQSSYDPLLPGRRTYRSTDTQRFFQDWSSLNTDHALVAVVDTPTSQQPQDAATVRYATLAVVEEEDGAET